MCFGFPQLNIMKKNLKVGTFRKLNTIHRRKPLCLNTALCEASVLRTVQVMRLVPVLHCAFPFPWCKIATISVVVQ